MVLYWTVLDASRASRGEGAVAAELTPAEKAEQKAKRVVADKLRKKKVNAPSRILKIQARN